MLVEFLDCHLDSKSSGSCAPSHETGCTKCNGPGESTLTKVLIGSTMETQLQGIETFEQRFSTVRKVAVEYRDIISEAGLRNLIWQAEAYAKHPKQGLPSNDFLPVIVRPPNQRKVLLDKVEFEKWLTRNSIAPRNTHSSNGTSQ